MSRINIKASWILVLAKLNACFATVSFCRCFSPVVVRPPHPATPTVVVIFECTGILAARAAEEEEEAPAAICGEDDED